MRSLCLSLPFAVLLFFVPVCAGAIPPGNVLFFHPDGAGLDQWTAARALHVGPDGMLAWDRLPELAPYRGHMLDEIAGTSNGGATTHAFGYKVEARGSFGRDGDGTRTPPADRPIVALSGYPGSLLREAANDGHPTGLVNDGHIAEPGTGAFAAEVGNRDDWAGIALEIIAGRDRAQPIGSSPDTGPVVILGGGERDFVPAELRRCAPREARRARQQGLRTYPLDCRVHGLDWSEPAAPGGAADTDIGHIARGRRNDGRNLLVEAAQAGYLVIRTRAEFEALRARLAADPRFRPKVLGLFAAHHTFNDRPEEELVAKGFVAGGNHSAPLILFGARDPADPGFDPPRIDELTKLAITVLDRHSDAVGKPWLLIAEPESTDNFGNANNAVGTLTALGYADAAIAVALERLARQDQRPTTLLVVADSDASGLAIVPVPPGSETVPSVRVNPALEGSTTMNPLDGVRGQRSAPFLAAPDARGRRLPFGVLWNVAAVDTAGGILARAASNRDRFASTISRERPTYAPSRDDLAAFATGFDNTDVYRYLYAHLFGRWLPKAESPAPTRVNLPPDTALRATPATGQCSRRPGEAELAPRFVNGNRDRVRKVQRATTWPHRQAYDLVTRHRSQVGIIKAGRFRTKHERIAGSPLNLVVPAFADRREDEQPRWCDRAAEAVEIAVHPEICKLSIVEAGPPELRVVDREAERLDEVQSCARVGAEPDHISSVRRDFWPIQDDVEHAAATVNVEGENPPVAGIASRGSAR